MDAQAGMFIASALGQARCIRMKLSLPLFQSGERYKKFKRDEQVFADAIELALLRLEQCIADLPKNGSSLEMEFHLPSNERVH